VITIGRAGVRHRLRTLSAIMRVGTSVAGAALCLAGGLIGSGRLTTRLALAMGCVALLVAFAQVVNDLVDVDVDRLAKPDRPLVSGALTVRTARALAAVLAVVGIASSVPLGPGFVAVAVAIAALASAYSLIWKNTVLWGNAVVALLASTTISFGAAANGRFGPLALGAQATVFAFMVMFEVVKTGADVDGDRAAGLRTIATVTGMPATARVAAGTAVAYVALATMLVGWADRPLVYAVLMGAAAVTFVVVAALRLLTSAASPASMRSALAPLRVAWFGGAAALFAL